MRALIIGWGNIARRHAANLRVLVPDARIVVWRRECHKGETPEQDSPVERYVFGPKEAIYDWKPDIAVIASPASHHVGMAMSLAYEGVHMLVEKPLSDSLRNVDYLIGLCDRYHAVLYIGYDLRHFHPLVKVREALKEGRIGRPLSIRCEVGQYLPDWRPGRDYRTSVSARRDLGGGVLLELSHEIDYARWLMGEVVSVSAMTGKMSDLEIDVEDTADVLLRFEGGAQGSVHLDMTDRASVRKCRIVGTEGSIEADLIDGRTTVTNSEGEMEELWSQFWQPPDPFLAEMRHFLACCRGEAVPPVDGKEGRRVLEVCLAAKRSAEERREVRV